MNRYATILVILLILVVLVGGGVALFLYKNAQVAPGTGGISNPVTLPSIPEPSSQTKAAVQSAFESEIAPYNNDNVKLYDTAVVGSYALQLWRGTHTGGEGLLTYDSKKGGWVVITTGGGAWSVAGLVEAGVPQETASALLVNLPHY